MRESMVNDGLTRMFIVNICAASCRTSVVACAPCKDTLNLTTASRITPHPRVYGARVFGAVSES